MKNNPFVLIGLFLIVGGGVYVLSTSEGELAGHATGASSAKGELWDQLAVYEDSYLREWSDVFAEGTPPAVDVLSAFNEVGFAVTGEGGLWRNKIPNQWLGCKEDAATAPCKALSAHEDVFVEWDQFQTEIGELNERKARRFIAKNKTRMLEYLDTYVPKGKTNSEIEGTRFFSDSLKPALNAGE
jgi:hypothetical protein